MVLVEVLLEDVVVGVYDINHLMVPRGGLMIVKCSILHPRIFCRHLTRRGPMPVPGFSGPAKGIAAARP